MNAAESIQRAVACLPPRIREAVIAAVALHQGSCDEIRLRRDGQASLTVQGRNVPLGIVCTRDEVQETFSALSGHSLYAHSDTMCEGFIFTETGLRIGVVGQAFLQNGKVSVVGDISSLAIRLFKRCPGMADRLLPYAVQSGVPAGVLVWSPPGVGKTTMLRELAFLLANGEGAIRTVIVDTRYELTMGLRYDLADVLLGYPRAEGMEIAVRTMSPQVVVCDEIADMRDAEAVRACTFAGVAVIASAHAGSFSQLRGRKPLNELLSTGAFPTVVELYRSGGSVNCNITDAEGRMQELCVR